MRVLRNCLIFFVLISGCNSGPEIMYCNPFPEIESMRCRDERKPEEERKFNIPFIDTDGWRCLDSDQMNDFGRACANDRCVRDLKLDVCRSRPMGGIHCEHPDGSESLTPYPESEDFVCTFPEDFRTLYSYCEERC